MSALRAVILAMVLEALAGAGRAAAITDLRPIPLKPGVNPVPGMAPDGRDGVIVQGDYSTFPSADASNIQFLLLLRYAGGWEIVGVEGVTQASWRTVGPELIGSVPHAGEDWRRAVTFARARIDGKPAFVVLAAQRDLDKMKSAYDAVPVDVSTYSLEPDSATGQDHLVLIDLKRAKGCYVNAWLAMKDAFGLPLPKDYEGPAAAQACPK
jgi:hypothetical protein